MQESNTQTGRPTTFTQEKAELVIEAVRRGLTLKLAASCAGVSYDTLNRWRIKGCKEPDSEYCQFCISLEQALGEAALSMVDCISKAAQTDWKAATWLLSRRHPDQFSESKQPEASSLDRFKIEHSSFF